jgi:hypothetical protein
MPDVKLTEKLTQSLVNQRESGMGYQDVVVHVDGSDPVIGLVLNCETLITNAEIDVEKITSIVVS